MCGEHCVWCELHARSRWWMAFDMFSRCFALIRLFDARGPQNQFEFYVEDSIDFDRFGLYKNLSFKDSLIMIIIEIQIHFIQRQNLNGTIFSALETSGEISSNKDYEQMNVPVEMPSVMSDRENEEYFVRCYEAHRKINRLLLLLRVRDSWHFLLLLPLHVITIWCYCKVYGRSEYIFCWDFFFSIFLFQFLISIVYDCFSTHQISC